MGPAQKGARVKGMDGRVGGWMDGKEEMGKGVGCGVAEKDFWVWVFLVFLNFFNTVNIIIFLIYKKLFFAT